MHLIGLRKILIAAGVTALSAAAFPASALPPGGVVSTSGAASASVTTGAYGMVISHSTSHTATAGSTSSASTTGGAHTSSTSNGVSVSVAHWRGGARPR